MYIFQYNRLKLAISGDQPEKMAKSKPYKFFSNFATVQMICNYSILKEDFIHYEKVLMKLYCKHKLSLYINILL